MLDAALLRCVLYRYKFIHRLIGQRQALTQDPCDGNPGCFGQIQALVAQCAKYITLLINKQQRLFKPGVYTGVEFKTSIVLPVCVNHNSVQLPASHCLAQLLQPSTENLLRHHRLLGRKAQLRKLDRTILQVFYGNHNNFLLINSH